LPWFIWVICFHGRAPQKEIGVRKVLGASVQSVVAFVIKRFFKARFIIGRLLHFLLHGFSMNKWLEDFAYRISIGWSVFIIAGFAALLIALLTISFQAIKAAIANPVKSLRNGINPSILP
jgi:putative ABC transport system permease protein